MAEARWRSSDAATADVDRFGVVTGRSSHIVEVRCAELGIEIIRQGMERKTAVVDEIVRDLGLSHELVCYIGDDLPDLAVLKQVGLAVAVADACAEVRQAAHHVTTLPGGRGAVRETIEFVLKSQGRWDDLIERYLRH